MIAAVLVLSVALGTTCGAAAFMGGCGIFESLIIYAVAGQIAFLLLSLITAFQRHRGRSDSSDTVELALGYWVDTNGS